ncbi:AAA family ATPase [Candidatus Woesearchaeota archaeon]|jgi:CMP/dCMP kinase|nr:AAA family ATPase [Candidatus Woesearchaeota archaeon]MBT4368634.1 AAA family ATPase [Candidatus Woesearchaeota archaeon]MBT4713057.1 AAA family ATPase [Candidatus Woesearchaeota archaeon]MBT6638979.1 AAA family ATPase [Candidatus Woesearchaeota archaeon]MBT7134178.1 AAA family ATPase [Candidatus Woesearchaeota archaeon]
MKITIAGTPGSGKSTVGKLLAKQLNYSYYDVGGLRREIARKRGITIEQLNVIGETESWTDTEVDNSIKEMGKKQDDIVVVGRTAFHFIPDSLKVFLECDLEAGAKRIFKGKKRATENYYSLQSAIKKLKERIDSDKARYKKYYNLDPYNKTNFDLMIDSTNLTIKEVMNKILDFIE